MANYFQVKNRRRISILFTVLVLSIVNLNNSSGQPVGWASVNGGTTGGTGGDTLLVSNRSELIDALKTKHPRIILIADTINLNHGEAIIVDASNLSIIGKGTNAMIRYGGLKIYGHNVIIQNLTIGKSYIPGHWDGKGDPSTDALTLYGSNIWVDHCDLTNSYDGLLDVSSAKNSCGNYITVSWTRFSNHNKVMLIGSRDTHIQCRNHLKVSVHHCWFDGTSEFYDSVDNTYYRVQQRMPRVRFGDVHVFNNYYENAADYCIAARIESDVVVENNYFRNLENTHFRKDLGIGERDPELKAIGNYYDHVNGDKESFGEAFDPSSFYNYSTDQVIRIPEIVMNGAGTFNRAVNTDPMAQHDTIIIGNDKKITIQPLENDTDADGDSLRISTVINDPESRCKVYPDRIKYDISKNNTEYPIIIEYQIIDFEGGVDTANIVILEK